MNKLYLLGWRLGGADYNRTSADRSRNIYFSSYFRKMVFSDSENDAVSDYYVEIRKKHAPNNFEIYVLAVYDGETLDVNNLALKETTVLDMKRVWEEKHSPVKHIEYIDHLGILNPENAPSERMKSIVHDVRELAKKYDIEISFETCPNRVELYI